MNELKALDLLERELKILSSTPHGRRAFFASLPFLAAGCATQEKTRYREGSNAGQNTQLTVQDEVKMTQEVLPQMRKDYPAHPNPEVQKYINQLGQKIVAANGLNSNPYNYNFTVVDSKTVNAFALPAGTVFVTAPLIKTASTEAELAGVVGHEIGHIKARHTAERMDQASRGERRSVLWGIGGAILGGAAGFGLGKLLCKDEDKACLKRAALYGAGAGGLGGLLIQKYAFMMNSQEDEMEADRIGFRTAYNAGYHKDHVGGFYNKLLAMENEYKKSQSSVLAPLTDAMSTHPPSKERVNQMNQMASQVAAKSGAVVSTKTFERMQKLLG